MLLTVDIGNTSITLGLFDKEDYVKEFRLSSDKDLSREEYSDILVSLLKDYDITGCIIASVVRELDEKMVEAIKSSFGVEPIFLNSKTYTGVKIVTDRPEEVGADRIANAVAASYNFSGAVIVIDFGTATSFDIINENHEFIGGVIALGINNQLKCLNSATSRLPKLDANLSPSAIGHNTSEAVLSGVIRGTAYMVDGIIEQCEKELGQKVTVVATGGYCGLIENYLKRPFDVVDPIFTLKGLQKVYSLNAVDLKK